MYAGTLDEMKGGWFAGNFQPVVFKTEAVEAAVKTYKKGEREAAHYHKIATEVTVIQNGSAKMFDKIWEAGDVIVVEPGDVTSFEALADTVTFVLKIPGVLGDKYSAEGERLC